MDKNTKQKLISDVEEFELRKDEMNPKDAELFLLRILTPLLKSEGFEIKHTGGAGDNGIDFIANKKDESIGIEYKHFQTKRKVATEQVRSLIGAALINNFNRVILLTGSTFSKQAILLASQVAPISVELIDIDSLKTWTSKIEANYDDTEVVKVLRTFTQRIIELISKNSRTLDEIEWRDLERVVAEIFKGIGFTVTLTPGSKDGGKDVILECLSEGTLNSFIIEIKHWRSGQRVGEKGIKEFVKVITKEKRKGGLFLSTYGFTENAAESITEIERKKVKFGEENKIVSLCQTYIKRKSGIWDNETDLPKILFNDTL